MAIERLMGLDIGSHRIGVAIGDELGIVATPVGFVRPGPSDRTAFVDLIRRHQATRLVVGIPRSMSGKEGPQAKEVRAYATALASDLKLPLTFWDERLTTVIAERSLISGWPEPPAAQGGDRCGRGGRHAAGLPRSPGHAAATGGVEGLGYTRANRKSEVGVGE